MHFLNYPHLLLCNNIKYFKQTLFSRRSKKESKRVACARQVKDGKLAKQKRKKNNLHPHYSTFRQECAAQRCTQKREERGKIQCPVYQVGENQERRAHAQNAKAHSRQK